MFAEKKRYIYTCLHFKVNFRRKNIIAVDTVVFVSLYIIRNNTNNNTSVLLIIILLSNTTNNTFIFNSGGGVSNDSSDSEMEDKTAANLALLKLDEWLHLKLDPEVSKKSLLGLLHVEEL